MLRKLANMRAAKARLRQERIAAGLLEHEPKMIRYFPLELGVRDKATGEVAWVDLRSVRDAARRLGVVLKFYSAGMKSVSGFAGVPGQHSGGSGVALSGGALRLPPRSEGVPTGPAVAGPTNARE